jgi:hypothetical protein
MKVFWQDTETGETLPIVVSPATPGKEVAAPMFIHHSQSWADQLRVMYLDKHYPTDSPIVWDGPTAALTAPTVIHGDNEMLCGDQRFYQVPE